MRNKYEIIGETVNIHIKRRNNSDLITLVSISDLKRVNDEYINSWRSLWCENTKSYYVQGYIIKNGKSFTVRMHRWIMQPEDYNVIDHINHDTLDNRRDNLRELTNSENLQNRKGATRASKSGIRNVCWDKLHGKWLVQIYKNKRKIYVSRHIDLEEAKKVAIKMRSKLLAYAQ